MSVSYHESAKRHFIDASSLEANGGLSLGNASQLFGLSAECSLKAMLVGLGVPTESVGGVKDRQQFGHLPYLWREFVAFAHGHGGSMYVWMLNPGMAGRPPNPFAGWTVSDRYRNNVWIANQIRTTVVSRQRSDAQSCLKMLQQAMLDGIVT